MDYLDQRIRQLEREISAKRAELSNTISQLGSRRTALDNERRALDKAQQNHAYKQRLKQQGQEMLNAFNDGVSKQRAVTRSLEQFPNSKIALAVARKSAVLHDGSDYKNTCARMDWALQDVVNSLKKLADEIHDRQATCRRLESEIAELDGRRNHLNNHVIPQLQTELQRLRRQKLLAGGA
jgi:vacuolar-type H+-ATPase subunit D/Vma8